MMIYSQSLTVKIASVLLSDKDPDPSALEKIRLRPDSSSFITMTMSTKCTKSIPEILSTKCPSACWEGIKEEAHLHKVCFFPCPITGYSVIPKLQWQWEAVFSKKLQYWGLSIGRFIVMGYVGMPLWVRINSKKMLVAWSDFTMNWWWNKFV